MPRESYRVGPQMVHRRDRRRRFRSWSFWEVLVLAGVLAAAGGWAFARERPVRIVRRQPAADDAREAAATCGVCRGSGRTPPRFGETGGPFASAPRDRMCTACGGRGRLSADRVAEDEGPAVLTVREEHSTWEQVLQWLTLAPSENPRPIRLWGGRVPLVDAFLELHVPGARMVGRASDRFERRNDRWEAVIVAETGREELPVRARLHFVVEDREVIAVRVVE